MGKVKSDPRAPVVVGVCRVCGCTHDEPCDEGCAWADARRDLCTACVPLTFEQCVEKRRLAISELDMREETLSGELEDVVLRLSILRRGQEREGG